MDFVEFTVKIIKITFKIQILGFYEGETIIWSKSHEFHFYKVNVSMNIYDPVFDQFVRITFWTEKMF